MTEYVTNQSVETAQTGWTGVYNSTSKVTRVQPTGGSYDGTWAIRVLNTAKKSGAAGVNNASPYWLGSSKAGKTYTASAYVTGPAGTQITVLLRECTTGGSCTIGSKQATVKLSGGWQRVSTPYTAVRSGDVLRYSLYANSLPANGQFLADWFSLSAPSG